MGGTNNTMSDTKFRTNLIIPPEFGHIIQVAGKSLRTAKRVNISLGNDKTLNDKPLHISCRFQENAIIRNTSTNGKYSAEERNDGFGGIKNPFQAGGDFNFYIFVGVDRFHISLNNKHYCDLLFRTPINRISILDIGHDVELIKSVDHRRTFPSPFPLVHAMPKDTYFSNDIPVPFKAGHVIVMKAQPMGNPSGKFTIRMFVTGTSKQALHFDARFAPENVVVRNHSVNQTMTFNPQEAEKSGGFPFVFNQTFKVAIGFGETAFRIAVNGRLFCEYKYRALINNIGGIKVSEKNGMILNVLEVDHSNLDKTLRNFEALSRM